MPQGAPLRQHSLSVRQPMGPGHLSGLWMAATAASPRSAAKRREAEYLSMKGGVMRGS